MRGRDIHPIRHAEVVQDGRGWGVRSSTSQGEGRYVGFDRALPLEDLHGKEKSALTYHDEYARLPLLRTQSLCCEHLATDII